MADDGLFTLRVANKSSNTGAACIYLTDSSLEVPKAMPLAWLVKPLAPETSHLFQWTMIHNFVWAETGPLQPGKIFVAAQTFDADLSTRNRVTLTQQSGAYTFTDQTAGPRQGSLFITTDQTIPFNALAAGVGLGGRGAFVVQAQPSVALYKFTLEPSYWVTFGTFTQSEVLDPDMLRATQRLASSGGIFFQSRKVVFPPGVFSMTATLNPVNTWTITQGVL